MNDLATLLAPRRPCASHPLRGLTILAVEDSRLACETLRLMCQHSGARLRRADNLTAAHRHLRAYRPAAVIVDIGLPDGSGLDLIADLARTRPRLGAVFGTSGEPCGNLPVLAAGADGFLAKPLDSLATFQRTILAALPARAAVADAPRAGGASLRPDRAAFRDDMHHVATLLTARQDGAAIDYAAQFLRGVARAARDPVLERAAVALARCRPGGGRRAEAAQLVAMLHARIGRHAAI
ncbi:MAG: response regulator [Roseovarius sp.]|nr:response regulator [Roseovarius sp.]